MWGVRIHVSDPNRRTASTTASNNIPETHGMTPSQSSILAIFALIFRSFPRFPTTADQFSSAAVKTCPMYYNDVAITRGLQYY